MGGKASRKSPRSRTRGLTRFRRLRPHYSCMQLFTVTVSFLSFSGQYPIRYVSYCIVMYLACILSVS